MKQVPDYIVKKTLDAFVAEQLECEYFEPFVVESADPNRHCTVRSPEGKPGCTVCELVAYWREST